jgi:hypothetical protein
MMTSSLFPAAVALALAAVPLLTQAQPRDGLPVLPAGEPRLLTEPYLQNPSESAVSVVWLTNFGGGKHYVLVERGRGWNGDRRGNGHGYGRGQGQGGKPVYRAETQKLERLLEDGASKLEQAPPIVSRRVAYRHEAVVDGLVPGAEYSYWVVSETRRGEELHTGPHRLQALPYEGKPLQILLTSDQQERYNTLASYEKVAELFPDLDAIFFAGDLANHPRRGSEWLDNYRTSWHEDPRSANPAFFPALQGTFGDQVPESPFRGGALLQNVPFFPSVANHEVSGRYRPNETYLLNGNLETATINSMFGDPQPRWFAKYQYRRNRHAFNPSDSPAVREQWIRDNSHDFEVYRDLFTLPDDGPEGEAYYSKKIGDVFLISMNVSRIWRNWNIGPNDRSKFVELLAEVDNPDAWGFGEHIFTPFGQGTPQYRWLRRTLKSDEFKSSKYRVVMFHQSAHGLGDNAVPVLTDPVMHIEYLGENGTPREKQVLMPQNDGDRMQAFATEVEPLLGRIQAVRYEYPVESDYFRRDIEPMLERYGVDLVLTGHSHVWNRTQVGDMHLMETSNVGNCFGAYWTQPDGTPWQGRRRVGGTLAAELDLGPALSRWDADNYARTDDPQGREPILPTLANPMVMFEGEPAPVPFVCSNNVTVFTILDTALGAVRSFVFDVRDPGGEVIEFDRFAL